MKRTQWDAALVGKVVALWVEGHSAGSIAARLPGRGLTRSSVIGKLMRLGHLKTRTTTTRYLAQTKSQRQAAARTNRIAARTNMVYRPAMPDLVVRHPKPGKLPQDPPALGTLVSFEALEAGMCRFPSGEVGKPGFGFCGRQSIPQQSYCPHHHAIAWVAPVRTKKPVSAAVLAVREDA